MPIKRDRGETTLQWLELLYRLYNKTVLAQDLDISTAALRDWERGYKAINDDLARRFARLAHSRIQVLKHSRDHFSRIVAEQSARRLRELDNTTPIPAVSGRSRANTVLLHMLGGRRALYSEVKESANENDVSAASLNSEATRLGVVKVIHGTGPHRYSVWSLPPEFDYIPKRDDSEGVREMEAAATLLEDYLPMKYGDLALLAEEEGVSEVALRKAATTLGVVRDEGNRPHSLWSMPD